MCCSILGVLQKSPNSSNQPGEIIIPTLQMRDQGSCSLSKVIPLESSLARFDAEDCFSQACLDVILYLRRLRNDVIRYIQPLGYLVLIEVFCSGPKHEVDVSVSFSFKVESRSKDTIQVSEVSGISHKAFLIKWSLPMETPEQVGGCSRWQFPKTAAIVSPMPCALQYNLATPPSRGRAYNFTPLNLGRLCDCSDKQNWKKGRCLWEASYLVRSMITLRPPCCEKPKPCGKVTYRYLSMAPAEPHGQHPLPAL